MILILFDPLLSFSDETKQAQLFSVSLFNMQALLFLICKPFCADQDSLNPAIDEPFKSNELRDRKSVV